MFVLEGPRSHHHAPATDYVSVGCSQVRESSLRVEVVSWCHKETSESMNHRLPSTTSYATELSANRSEALSRDCSFVGKISEESLPYRYGLARLKDEEIAKEEDTDDWYARKLLMVRRSGRMNRLLLRNRRWRNRGNERESARPSTS